MLAAWLLASLLAPPPVSVPESVSSAAVFSKRCAEIVYSSNRDDLHRPFSISLRGGAPGAPAAIPVRAPYDLLARSLSHDCRFVAAVSDVEEQGRFQVFLIEKGDGLPRRISLAHHPGADEGEPHFSPVAPILAFLSEGRLALHDYEAQRFLDAGRAPMRFTHLVWSPDGTALFLVDRSTSLWRFSLATREYERLWQAPRVSDARRMPWSDGAELLFLSDHESAFNQIYALDLASRRVRLLHRSEADKFSPRRLANGELVFREARRGSYVVRALRRDADPAAEPRTLSPERGVVYDFAFELGEPVFLFADDARPTSLYRGAALAPLVPTAVAPAQPAAQLVASAEGATHLLYRPTGGTAPRGVAVWLHGGPHEDVSPRFNPFWSELLSLGHAVYALNYPGSTGAGNGYELRGLPRAEALRRQVEAVEREIARLGELGLGAAPLVLVGVSYGSLVAHEIALGGRVRVAKLVDLSGVGGALLGRAYAGAAGPLPKLLFVHGDRDPFLASAGRPELFAACARRTQTTVVAVPREGHYVKKRASLGQIAAALRAFLGP